MESAGDAQGVMRESGSICLQDLSYKKLQLLFCVQKYYLVHH
jgi:hypothetical protein